MRRMPGNDLIVADDLYHRPVVMTRERRGRHLYAVGATGTGKTKLLESWVRQDMLNWAKSRSGVVVIDPHGTLVDSLLAWAAACGLSRLPIVPIDLRRSDWAVSYNVLRPRPLADPAVVVGNLAIAIAHAWGQGDLNATPRLAKWLRAVLATVYEHQATLGDALELLSNAALRRAMTARLKDRFAAAVWESTEGLRPGEFLEQVESTLNRLAKFLANQTLRATLCQSGPSFDFSQALDEGAIVLVSLATSGAQVDAEDARTLGSMLLSDLWTAAQIRGKAEEGSAGVRPCYVYVDEFQEYVNPTIASALDQARGFGLHFTLAHQYPTQLRDRGELGRMIYNSVMANARSKVVFALDHPTDLPELALWLGRGEIDLLAVKHQHYATKVLGHQLLYLPSYSQSSSTAEGRGTTDTVGQATSESETEGLSETEGWSRSVGGARTTSSGQAMGATQSSAEGESLGIAWHDPTGLLGLGGSPPLLTPCNLSQGQSSNAGHAQSKADSTGLAETTAWSETVSGALTRSRSSGMSRSCSQARSDSRSSTTGRTSGTSYAPLLMPVMGQEASPPQFWSLEEQTFRLTQRLAGLAKCHALVRLADEQVPREIVSRWLEPPLMTPRGRLAAQVGYLKRLAFARPMSEALHALAASEERLAKRLGEAAAALEPTSYARPVEAHLLPAPPAPAKVHKPRAKKKGA